MESTTRISPRLDPEGAAPRQGRTPAADIVDSENGLALILDLPGADENSVAVSLDKDVLSIVAQVEREAPTGYTMAHSEIDWSGFERAFRLPKGYDPDAITGEISDGVLRLSLVKKQAQDAKRIEVRPG